MSDDLKDTCAYLANELRKAHQTAAGLHHATQKLTAEVNKLKAELAACQQLLATTKAERDRLIGGVDLVEDYTPPAADVAPTEGEKE